MTCSTSFKYLSFFFFFLCFLLCSKDPLFSPRNMRWLLAGMRRINHPPSNFTHDKPSVARFILFRGEGLCCLDVACGKVAAGIILCFEDGGGHHAYMPTYTFQVQLKEVLSTCFSRYFFLKIKRNNVTGSCFASNKN